MQEFLIIIIVVVIIIIIIIIVSLLGTKQHNLNTVKHRTNIKGRQYEIKKKTKITNVGKT